MAETRLSVHVYNIKQSSVTAVVTDEPSLPTSCRPRISTSMHIEIIGQIVTYCTSYQCTSDGTRAVSESVQR